MDFSDKDFKCKTEVCWQIHYFQAHVNYKTTMWKNKQRPTKFRWLLAVNFLRKFYIKPTTIPLRNRERKLTFFGGIKCGQMLAYNYTPSKLKSHINIDTNLNYLDSNLKQAYTIYHYMFWTISRRHWDIFFMPCSGV